MDKKRFQEFKRRFEYDFQHDNNDVKWLISIVESIFLEQETAKEEYEKELLRRKSEKNDGFELVLENGNLYALFSYKTDVTQYFINDNPHDDWLDFRLQLQRKGRE